MDELIIGIFAFVGGISRYGLDHLIPFGDYFPVATLVINVLGSFLLALVTTAWSLNERISARLTLGIGTGLIGAFTTFSSFSLEIFDLLVNHHYLLGIAYATLSLVSGVVGAGLGVFLGEKLKPTGEELK
ncbi:CrcB protein [Pediococcus damnosus]|uniref:Fluoride-specific ion channel FluC n=1 Tax=Pediococcus damnosus TaxID=51663 RepID=A0A0R2GZ65_9LACO|nr:CrcB family protein [Pediococcus damnosus]AMV59764.1 CrcB protein [Pediococcus damnosus]AMV61987.1 CrcB protein [Pediococcus damnosus]AMV64010.1 CrcB protein [Pediococcus damnosus]AMV66132.1 CrcB protein [Pediococcus damnosus]AMV68420.1 CrcB protein [Pediococcus damnosus]